jgi:hypothetical protein
LKSKRIKVAKKKRLTDSIYFQINNLKFKKLVISGFLLVLNNFIFLRFFSV